MLVQPGDMDPRVRDVALWPDGKVALDSSYQPSQSFRNAAIVAAANEVFDAGAQYDGWRVTLKHNATIFGMSVEVDPDGTGTYMDPQDFGGGAAITVPVDTGIVPQKAQVIRITAVGADIAIAMCCITFYQNTV
jgi:hypothetical protein